MSEAAVGTGGTNTAEMLAQFWQELLDVETVCPDDHLLERGGNSLVATMLANRIEFAWGFRPSMTELMTRSFKELSALCDQSRK
jgi:phosphopantetheine binding protein